MTNDGGLERTPQVHDRTTGEDLKAVESLKAEVVGTLLGQNSLESGAVALNSLAEMLSVAEFRTWMRSSKSQVFSKKWKENPTGSFFARRMLAAYVNISPEGLDRTDLQFIVSAIDKIHARELAPMCIAYLKDIPEEARLGGEAGALNHLTQESSDSDVPLGNTYRQLMDAAQRSRASGEQVLCAVLKMWARDTLR